MKWSWFGRAALALTSAVGLGLSMTACGGGTIAYLWGIGTTGTNNGEIVGYLVDDYTGNLTAVPGQPYATEQNPVSLVVRPGGRFLYVINQGSGYGPGTAGTSEGIDTYAIGGEGSLTFEAHTPTQGYGHLWATFDTTGGFLYVLDKYNPNYQPDKTKANYNPDANGAITTFSSDASTGRLNLVNQTASTQPGQASPTYLEVGTSPVRMATGGSCLFTLNGGDQTITSYAVSNGQLGVVTTGTLPVGSVSGTSIAGSGQYMFVTDNNNGTGPGRIFNYTVGASCALTAFSAGASTTNDASVTNPTNVLLSTSGKYVYVLNASSSTTAAVTSGSTVTGWNIVSGQLNELSSSPFHSGSGPTCMVEDPTSKYLYTSDLNDGTITGFDYTDTTGELGDLQRGSTFKTSTTSLVCIALSGSL